MANILQVTQPAVPNDHRSTLENQVAKGQAENTRIQNPVDLSRVVRPDGQTTNAAQQESRAIIDYDSNYGAFVQRLNTTPTLMSLLEGLFVEDNAGYLLPDQGVMGTLLEQLRAGFQMETPQQLLELFMGHESMQAKFSGELFQNLRALLAQNTSEPLKQLITSFLKGYNDYSSGTHLLEQMHSMTEHISRQMLGRFSQEFQQLAQLMDWSAPNGETEGNTAVLNGTLIPFLSNYISRTHDYGAVRDATMMFILHAVKYENGSHSSLQQLVDQMMNSKEFVRLYAGDFIEDLNEAVQKLEQHRTEGGLVDQLADGLAKLLEEGSRGGAGLERVQQYYNVFDGFLLNESVYMPLLHLLIPFNWQGTDVLSEIWVDPDAQSEEDEGGRKIRMMFKFHIQQLGNFDMALEFQDRRTDLRLYVPAPLKQKTEEIQGQIGRILKKNGITPNRLQVQEKTGELRVGDVFPEIREKENSVNVTI